MGFQDNDIEIEIEDDMIEASVEMNESIVIDNYNSLKNKPSINNVELSGNKTLDELGIQEKGDFATKDYVEQEIANFDFIKIATELPETGLVNRTYFVPKTDTENNDLYDEYMWVDNKWELLGTKQIEVDLTDYVKNTDYATSTKGGVLKINAVDGFNVGSDGRLGTTPVTVDSAKAGYPRIVKGDVLDIATFYGLAKASGDTTQASSDNDVGTYTEEAKKAIQKMLGIGIGGYSKLGLVQTVGEMGVTISNVGTIRIVKADDNVITDSNRNKMINRFTNAPIVAYNLDLAVKTGLISNHLELTEEEKTLALNWLGVNDLVGDINTVLDDINGNEV